MPSRHADAAVERAPRRAGSVEVVVHTDTWRSAKAVRALGDVERAIAVADVFDSGTTRRQNLAPTSFALAVLEGMGKSDELFSVKRRCEPLCAAWLRSRRWTVVVPDVQMLEPERTLEAAQWLAGHGARVLLCIATGSEQKPDKDHADLARYLAKQLGCAIVFGERLKELRPPARQRRPAAAPVTNPTWPSVPHSDGFVFAADCKALLAPADCALVAAEQLAAKRRIQQATTPTADGRWRKESAMAALRAEMEAATCPDHLVTIVRAAQVGLVRLWHVKVDTERLLAAAAFTPLRGQLEERELWRRLDVYRDPDIGAIAALYLYGLDPAIIGALSVGEVDLEAGPDAAQSIEIANGPDVVIPAPASRYLWVLAAYRTLGGAGASDPLFDTHRREGVDKRYVRMLLDQPGTELGIELVRGRLFESRLPDEKWLEYFGITFTWIAPYSVSKRLRKKAL